MTGAVQALKEATGDRAYDDLGEAVQANITHKEWMWLSDEEKARFIQDLTEPESFDDPC